MIYLRLFYEFFKIGLFAVGGGLATIPFLYDMAEATGWFPSAMVADMIAVSESTPGPLGVNMATYAGFHAAGPLGGVIATLGLVTPSVIVIVIVAHFLSQFQENFYVKSVFYGLRPAVTGLIAAAGFGVLKIALLAMERFELSGKILELFQWKAILLFVILYFVMRKWKAHPVVFIGASALIGIIFQFG